ncbi:AMIN-like domain-containing (lipo)protein [Geodermatophilus sp. SYSU D00815]
MTSRRALSLPAALLVAGALLAGCGGSDGSTGTDTAAGAGTPTTSAPSSAGTTAPDDAGDGGDGGDAGAPAFPANTEPDTAAASADSLVTVTGIRTGRQDGFDRVVLEVAGTGTPGWDVRYVDQAASQGSGEPVDVAGDAVLQVTVTGVGYPYDTGEQEYAGPDPLPGEGTSTVTEVAFDATFEGTTVAFIGTTGRVPFRVFALADPTRIVVDLRDA